MIFNPQNHRLKYLLFILALFVSTGCKDVTSLRANNTQGQNGMISDCQNQTDPWDTSLLQQESSIVIQRIDDILAGSSLEGQGQAVFLESQTYAVNPAFALAMFRKESSFAAIHTRAYRNRNPGNIIATGNCRGLPSGATCSGNYGEISTDGRFGVYANFQAGIEAYFKLLAREYKPGSKRNCADILCVITAYCPPSECDVELYQQQVTQWMGEYQCRLAGKSKEPNLTTVYPENTLTDTAMPPTTTTFAKAQIGIQKPLYLTYDPAKWNTEKFNWAGGSYEILINKKYGCILRDNEPMGTPENWQKNVFTKQVGNLTYEINSWTNIEDGITLLMIYHYPPGNFENYRRIELVNHQLNAQIIIPFVEDINLCVPEAEEVLRLSEEEIVQLKTVVDTTQIIPMDINNWTKVIKGKCWTGSLAIYSPEAWRCISGNQIFDLVLNTGWIMIMLSILKIH